MREWRIYSAPDWDDSIFGPPTGKDGVEVVPRADAERYREALRRIAAFHPQGDASEEGIMDAIVLAREALSSTQPTPDDPEGA